MSVVTEAFHLQMSYSSDDSPKWGKNYQKGKTKETFPTRSGDSDTSKPKARIHTKMSPSSASLMSSVKLDEEERLQKVLARSGIASRRQAEVLVSRSIYV